MYLGQTTKHGGEPKAPGLGLGHYLYFLSLFHCVLGLPPEAEQHQRKGRSTALAIINIGILTCWVQNTLPAARHACSR